ncbi:MAG: HesA/MoeB/ThiF family protein [Solirubrobacteraceae bacterium]
MSATRTEPQPHWHEAQPERLAWELAEFSARGLAADTYDAGAGRIGIQTELRFDGEPILIRVVFPFDYPDVEPTAYGPAGLLGRHQHRRDGNFCLLENPSLDWWPTMSAAQLVDEDLRWLLEDSAAGPEVVERGEADMPEPLSQHIPVDPRRVALVPDPFWQLELEATEGELITYDAALSAGQIIAEVQGIGECDRNLLKRFRAANGERHAGRWTALAAGALEPYPSLEDLFDAAVQASPQVLRKLKGTLERDRKRDSVDGWVGVTFLEEGPRRRQWRRGWLLLEVRLDRRGQWQKLRALRAQALTAGERARRIPELDGLAHASMLVVGAGSLGSPIVFELAKAGVGRTTVVDDDRYDVNNAVRHVLDPRWAATHKAVAVAIEAEYLNPFVQVDSHVLRVGAGPDDNSQIERLIADADVVVDATGSHQAARILQRRCREAHKTLVLAALTAGSYGGEVAVFRPDGPCFWCFVLAQHDGLIPEALAGPVSNVTPIGCSAPAFSGAGFDATALAALATRTAIRATGKSAYPPLNYDYIIVDFRGDESSFHGALSAHPGCPVGH